MRDWCKHKFGYVNFDDEFMYFTSSGNWSDTTGLGEYNEESTRKSSSAERYKSMSYLALLFVIIFSILWGVGFHSMSYTAILGLAWLAYSAYHYMAPGLTGEFKIAYSKVNFVTLEGRRATIVFEDHLGEVETHVFEGLDSKGIDLFTEVSDNYIPKDKKNDDSDTHQQKEF